MASAQLLQQPCVFCRRRDSDVSSEVVGETLRKEHITVHENCLYLSSGLCQGGSSEEEGIRGFMLEDIQREVKRGTLLKCVVCRETGASIGCSVKRCRSVGHMPCLHRAGYLFQFFDCFASFCPRHHPTQQALLSDFPLSHSLTECCICLSEVEVRAGFSQLFCPSCKTPFHRDCIQKQASAAGKYYLRCPVCKCKKEYVSEMLRMGISVPERDAEWESSGQFRENLEDSKYCNAACCLCPQGRSYCTQIGMYRIKKCGSCGQWLGHIHCMKSSPYHCSDCSILVNRQQPPPSPPVTGTVFSPPPSPVRPSTVSITQPSAGAVTHTKPVPPPESSLCGRCPTTTVSTRTVHTQCVSERTSISTTTVNVEMLPCTEECSCAVCKARPSAGDGQQDTHSTTASTATFRNWQPPVPQLEPTSLCVSIPRSAVRLRGGALRRPRLSLIVSLPRPDIASPPPPRHPSVHPKMYELIRTCPQFSKVALSVRVKRLAINTHTRTLTRKDTS